MSPVTPKFKSFDASILYFNGMYKLPVAAYPSIKAEVAWQNNKFVLEDPSAKGAVIKRIKDFFGTILQNELNEHKDILDNLSDPAQEHGAGYNTEIDFLVDLADILGDIQVYCASEMARFGIPNKEVLDIIMDSNFSKLDEKGNPIYDESGKVCKGPYYWKPEPKIRELLVSMLPKKEQALYVAGDDLGLD